MQQDRGVTRRSVGAVRTRRIAKSALPFFWLVYDHVVSNILSSHNVSSVVDNGTGDITVNYQFPPINAGYAVAGGAVGLGVYISNFVAASPTTGWAQTQGRYLTFQTDAGATENPMAHMIGVGHR